MTKKDYTTIATVIADTPMTVRARERMIAALVPELRKDNARFDADRFAAACRGEN